MPELLSCWRGLQVSRRGMGVYLAAHGGEVGALGRRGIYRRGGL
jgi:hypothetical protein